VCFRASLQVFFVRRFSYLNEEIIEENYRNNDFQN
jgi:hypothetical protein